MELSLYAQGLKLGHYRHFKGDNIEVLHIALDSEDHTKELVVYTHGDNTWVRPLTMFVEHVERDGYNGPRFVYLDTH